MTTKQEHFTVYPGGQIEPQAGAALDLAYDIDGFGPLHVGLDNGFSYIVISMGELTVPDPERDGWAHRVLIGRGSCFGSDSCTNSPLFYCRAAPIRMGEYWDFEVLNEMPGHDIASAFIVNRFSFNSSGRFGKINSLLQPW